jgi:hypothetical protein
VTRLAMAIVSAIAIVGCSPSEVDESLPTRAVHAFTGAVDPAYVGHWKGNDKMSGLDLKEDGTATIMSATESAGGRAESKITGEWKVDKPSLLLRYKMGTQEVTLKYQAKLNGDSLELIQSGNNHKNSYRRGAP